MKQAKRRYAGASVLPDEPAAKLIRIVSGPVCLWKMERGTLKAQQQTCYRNSIMKTLMTAVDG